MLIYTGFEITSLELLKGTFSGIIDGIATILFTYGVSKGLAGPASALGNIGAIVQTILDVTLLD